MSTTLKNMKKRITTAYTRINSLSKIIKCAYDSMIQGYNFVSSQMVKTSNIFLR